MTRNEIAWMVVGGGFGAAVTLAAIIGWAIYEGVLKDGMGR